MGACLERAKGPGKVFNTSCDLNFEKGTSVGEGQMLELEREMMQGNKREEQREVQLA